MNLRVDLSQISVTNSTFTDGRGNHIQATNSLVMLNQVTFADSEDSTAQGHGVVCETCYGLTITNCTFRNLTSLAAPAIQIKNQMEAETRIIASTFEGNTAFNQAGAIMLDRVGYVLIQDCVFRNNKASPNL